MMPAESARSVAARVVTKVIKQGAFLAAQLNAELERSELLPRDRGLATELAYGVIRTLPFLERRLSEFASLSKMSAATRTHLLVACYQLEFLERVPAHAAVDEAVTLCRGEGSPREDQFANAVLRKIASSARQTELQAAIWESLPSWLRKRLIRAVGEPAARQLVSPLDKPSLGLRLRLGATPPAWFADETTSVPGCPGAYFYTGVGDPRARDGFAEGLFVVQEVGAQMLVSRLKVPLGARVLDACAGRGNKTLLLAEAIGAEGAVLATDLHAPKLGHLREAVSRLSSPPREFRVDAWDWTLPPPVEWHGAFDAVLVDAPCTGTGTLRRRPEIARRLVPEDPARMSELQSLILTHAAQALKPGGRLLFATCSVLPEEGPEVLERARTTLELVEPDSFGWVLPGELPLDGYFWAVLRRPS